MENRRAPTSHFERVTITRPQKVLSVLFTLLAIILLGISQATSSWILRIGIREGLWTICTNGSCTSVETWSVSMTIHTIFSVTAVCLLFTATALILIAFWNIRQRYRLYSWAFYTQVIAVLLLAVCVILFPVLIFTEESMMLGWGYPVECASFVLATLATLLLFLDKKTEEIIYREKVRYLDEEGVNSD